MDDKPMRIEFAPGVLDELESEMSPSELQEFMDMLREKVADGSIFTESNAVSMADLEEDEPELFELLSERLSMVDTPKILH